MLVILSRRLKLGPPLRISFCAFNQIGHTIKVDLYLTSVPLVSLIDSNSSVPFHALSNL